MKNFIYYLIAINISAFIVFYVDKKKAVKHKWRVPEKTLFILCFIGGSIGGLMSMQIFRHKTKHPKFYIGVPLILILQISYNFV